MAQNEAHFIFCQNHYICTFLYLWEKISPKVHLDLYCIKKLSIENTLLTQISIVFKATNCRLILWWQIFLKRILEQSIYFSFLPVLICAEFPQKFPRISSIYAVFKLAGSQGDQMSLWKNTLKVAQPIFCQNLYITFFMEKAVQSKSSPNDWEFAQSGHPADSFLELDDSFRIICRPIWPLWKMRLFVKFKVKEFARTRVLLIPRESFMYIRMYVCMYVANKFAP
jgi:hypothetical protein